MRCSIRSHGSDAVRRRIAGFRADLLGEHLGVAPQEIEAAITKAGSAIGGVEALRGEARGRSLKGHQTPTMTDIEKWLADNEILDPEGPEELFEPIERRGLFRGRQRLPRRSAQ